MQTGLPVITIRGHHLFHLSQYLNTQPKAEEHFTLVLTGSELVLYGVEFQINKLLVFEQVASVERIVKVSASLDDVCKPCPNKDPFCSRSNHVDSAVAKAFGLKLGEYQSAEIADKLKRSWIDPSYFTFGHFFLFFFACLRDLPYAAAANSKNRREREKNLPPLTKELKKDYFEQMMSGYNMLKHQQNVL